MRDVLSLLYAGLLIKNLIRTVYGNMSRDDRVIFEVIFLSGRCCEENCVKKIVRILRFFAAVTPFFSHIIWEILYSVSAYISYRRMHLCVFLYYLFYYVSMYICYICISYLRFFLLYCAFTYTFLLPANLIYHTFRHLSHDQNVHISQNPNTTPTSFKIRRILTPLTLPSFSPSSQKLISKITSYKPRYHPQATLIKLYVRQGRESEQR